MPLFENFREVEVWSDGGPKHFKVSSLIYYFFSLQQQTNRKITYNFFAWYHGHSACDSAASHVKRAVVRFVNEANMIPQFSWQLSLIAEDVKGHAGVSLSPDPSSVIYIHTLHGIKSYHCFRFDSECILAFKLLFPLLYTSLFQSVSSQAEQRAINHVILQRFSCSDAHSPSLSIKIQMND